MLPALSRDEVLQSVIQTLFEVNMSVDVPEGIETRTIHDLSSDELDEDAHELLRIMLMSNISIDLDSLDFSFEMTVGELVDAIVVHLDGVLRRGVGFPQLDKDL